MNLKVILFSFFTIFLLQEGNAKGRGRSGGRSRGSSSGSWGHSTGSKPATTGSHYNHAPTSFQTYSGTHTRSQPAPIGWNVPKDHRPSAPEYTASKATAVHTQSGYPSSSGYNTAGYHHPPRRYNSSQNITAGYHHPTRGYNSSINNTAGYSLSTNYNFSQNRPSQGFNTAGKVSPVYNLSQGPNTVIYPPSGAPNPSVVVPIIVEREKQRSGQTFGENIVSTAIGHAAGKVIANKFLNGGGNGDSGKRSSDVSNNNQITYNNYYNTVSSPAVNSTTNSSWVVVNNSTFVRRNDSAVNTNLSTFNHPGSVKNVTYNINVNPIVLAECTTCGPKIYTPTENHQRKELKKNVAVRTFSMNILLITAMSILLLFNNK